MIGSHYLCAGHAGSSVLNLHDRIAVDNYWLLAFSRCEMVLICRCTTPAAWLGKAIVHMVLFLPCLDQARQTRQMESHTVCRQSHVMCLPALIGHGLLLLAEM